MKRLLCLLGCAALLAGCATVGGTPEEVLVRSARPEADFSAASPAPRGYSSNAGYALGFVFGGLRVECLDGPRRLPATVREERDLVYASPGGTDLRLDVYRPAHEAASAAPGILFVHGGWWKHGDKRDVRAYAVRYAERGYVTATVQYRLAGRAPFPAQVDDVRAAVRYLATHAAELGLDPGALALVGFSAGAHLAVLAAYAPRPDDPFPGVAAVVDFYGPADLTVPGAAEHSAVRTLMGSRQRLPPERYEEASPVHQVRPGLPPTLIFHGTIDAIVPVSQSEALFAALVDAGVETYFDPLEGWPHSMDAEQHVFRHCAEVMDLFLAKALRRGS